MGASTTKADVQWLAAIDSDGEVAPTRYAPGTRRMAPSWRTVCVVGGGTAGYFAALALRRAFPALEITLVESSRIPIIGVGEATVPGIVPFLHRLLKIDVHDFYRKVRPTWKLGIRFEWGLPEPYHFDAPFDWSSNNPGVLGSIKEHGDIRDMTMQAMMMRRNASPLFRTDSGDIQSLLHSLPFAYHFDVERLVQYLAALARERGIRHLDKRIVSAVPRPGGQAIDAIVTDDGERLAFDVFIDCSGFQSLLLEKTLGSPFVSYADSLYTDSALAFNLPHDGEPKPYTTAVTMNAGWCWTIPQRHENHLGYVYASPFISEDDARQEIVRRFGSADARLVKFRSERHEEAWRGNVVAIGNASGFIEPLQSTGVMMIAAAVSALIDLWPETDECDALRLIYNKRSAELWDGLRWLIAVHYKFNRRLNTRFWEEARSSVDVSGAAEIITAFRQLAPLHLRQALVRRELATARQIAFFGLDAYDCMLLGQGVSCELMPSGESHEAWCTRRDRVAGVLAAALPVGRALDLVLESPTWLDALLQDESSWVQRLFPLSELLARSDP